MFLYTCDASYLDFFHACNIKMVLYFDARVEGMFTSNN